VLKAALHQPDASRHHRLQKSGYIDKQHRTWATRDSDQSCICRTPPPRLQEPASPSIYMTTSTSAHVPIYADFWNVGMPPDSTWSVACRPVSANRARLIYVPAFNMCISGATIGEALAIFAGVLDHGPIHETPTRC
jgi:hypothetical protein